MDKYERIGFVKDVGVRFKEFSKKRNLKYSEMLTVMMDYFEEFGIEPDKENALVSNRKFMSKRFNDVIAILKNIEQKNLIPTKGKIDAIFSEIGEEIPEEKTPKFVEKKVAKFIEKD